MKSLFLEKILSIITEPEFRKFLIIGISSAIFVLSFTWILTEFFNLHFSISVAISVEISIIGAFFGLDKWAFSNKKKKHSFIFRLMRYNGICLISLGVNELILISFSVYLDFFYILSEIIAMGFSGATNYFLLKRFVMK
jgi:putative flippase GtrA